MEAYRVPVETRIFLETESRSWPWNTGMEDGSPYLQRGLFKSLYIYIGSCLLLDNGILF